MCIKYSHEIGKGKSEKWEIGVFENKTGLAQVRARVLVTVGK